ncbi:MAG: hypothetical protein J6Z36_04790 [Clostridia bacterium]|nr:hypothetical protein [Clostridia bacterium]
MENQEKNPETNENPVTEQPQTSKKEDKQIHLSISSGLLDASFALISVAFSIICSICAVFGVSSSIFYGIMSIFIYILPFVGFIWTYWKNRTIRSFALWLNAAALLIAFRYI